jgi:hypothetical protein
LNTLPSANCLIHRQGPRTSTDATAHMRDAAAAFEALHHRSLIPNEVLTITQS